MVARLEASCEGSKGDPGYGGPDEGLHQCCCTREGPAHFYKTRNCAKGSVNNFDSAGQESTGTNMNGHVCVPVTLYLQNRWQCLHTLASTHPHFHQHRSTPQDGGAHTPGTCILLLQEGLAAPKLRTFVQLFMFRVKNHLPAKGRICPGHSSLLFQYNVKNMFTSAIALSFLVFKIHLLIYLLMAVLVFVAARGLSLVAAHGLLVAVAPLVAEHRL